MKSHRRFAVLFAAACGLAAFGAHAQPSGSAAARDAAAASYPNRPITMIVPFPPGIVDSRARLIADRASRILGQPIVVENKAGAGQRIGTLALVRAPKDGYTIGVVTQASVVMAPALDPQLKYDALKDLQYLTHGYGSAFLLATHAKSGIKTTQQLFEAARAKPGMLKFSSSGLGTAYHVWTEALFDKAGVSLLHVPYRGAAQAQNDLIGGQVDVMLTTLGAKPQVDAGQLIPLGISSEQRSELLPNVPTIKESGLDWAMTTWLGFGAPAGIPGYALDKLSAAFKQALESKDVRDILASEGAVARYTTPAEFTTMVKGEIEMARELNKRLKIELQ
ncbi:MAG: Bug family tripartite tricarboxylate transporter substrate binding protein [Burkholderiaceae bacterium]